MGDFGSSRIVDNRQERRLLSLPESPRPYHAPEIVSGNRDYSFSADIFSVGVVFYAFSFGVSCYNHCDDYLTVWDERRALLTEEKPFHQMVQSCLAIDPQKRAELDQLLGSSFFDAFTDGSLERIASKRRFHVEDEIFNMDEIYDELLASVKSCRPDDEMSSHSAGLKPNSSIR